ncbi:hypothetical protein [Acrocarpospora catenulata]|uniref:hypothetical protein n=1 Tax=Acrocarpospora catenulata TaxID=2836182 RepID=UPI001BD967DE|nr:hypothetical protein [Acrocarpospora catenulata]
MWASLRFWGTALLGVAALPVMVALIADGPIPRDAPVWEAVCAGVMLLAGAWAGSRAQSRGIGRIFLFSGLLGVVRLVCELPDLVIASDGVGASWEAWLHYWIWVPQVMAPLLLATAIFPDGRPVLPIAVKLSVLAIAATSVTVATYNWPRSDGGAGYNPALLPPLLDGLPEAIAFASVPVAVASVLASLVIRWNAGEAAVRRSLRYPPAALLLGIVYALLRPVLPEAAGDPWEVLPSIYCAVLALAVRPLRRSFTKVWEGDQASRSSGNSHS